MSSLRHSPHRKISCLPYPSDLTDAQWQLVEPLIPPEGSATGVPCRPVTHSRRRIVDAILYVARTGCAWRQLPHDFPSWKTVYWYFARWNANGTLDHLHNALREKVRIAEGHNAEPTAGIVDAQSDSRCGYRRQEQPWLRRRQEDQRAQAKHRCRYDRDGADRRCHCGECSGSRRRQPGRSAGGRSCNAP